MPPCSLEIALNAALIKGLWCSGLLASVSTNRALACQCAFALLILSQLRKISFFIRIMPRPRMSKNRCRFWNQNSEKVNRGFANFKMLVSIFLFFIFWLVVIGLFDMLMYCRRHAFQEFCVAAGFASADVDKHTIGLIQVNIQA